MNGQGLPRGHPFKIKFGNFSGLRRDQNFITVAANNAAGAVDPNDNCLAHAFVVCDQTHVNVYRRILCDIS